MMMPTLTPPATAAVLDLVFKAMSVLVLAVDPGLLEVELLEEPADELPPVDAVAFGVPV
jgi:hypothetical protein